MVKRYSKSHLPVFEELEPRLLFSADIAEALTIDAVEQSVAEEPVAAAESAPAEETAAAPSDSAAAGTEKATLQTTVIEIGTSPKQTEEFTEEVKTVTEISASKERALINGKNTAAGDFSWTPTEAQVSLISSETITVMDDGAGNLFDSQTFTITVNDTNTAPVLSAIGDQSVDEDSTLTFTANATDSDVPADTLSFSLNAASIALGMTIDANTGEFSWTPSQALGGLSHGLTPSVTITVTDSGNGNLSDSETFTITVNDTNTAPVLSAIEDQTVDEETTLSFTASATDSDVPADTLAFSLDTASTALGMTIDTNTGEFSWTPTETQGGLTSSVTITVTDDGAGNLFDSQTFTITVNDTNTAPVLSAIGDKSVDEDSTLTFTASATDPDVPADTLSFSLDDVSISLGMTIDANTGAFSWTPTEAQGGTAPSVNITVTDSGSGKLVDSETFTITVNDINTAPVLDPIGDKIVYELTTLSFTATATDSDLPADTLTFSLDEDSIAAGMTITAAGDFSWSPTSAQIGVKPSVTITVTDSGTGNLIDSETFTITVKEINLTIDDVYDSDPAPNSVSVNAAIGTAVGFTAQATDPDQTDTVTYSLSNDSGGLFAINPQTGVISVAGNLDYETATIHALTVHAESTDGSFSELNFIIQIVDTNESDLGDENETGTPVDIGEVITVVPPVDDNPEYSEFENEVPEDIPEIVVVDSTSYTPEDTGEPEEQTEKEDDTQDTKTPSTPEETLQDSNILYQDGIGVSLDRELYTELKRNTKESASSVNHHHKVKTDAALLRVVKFSAKETIDFISPPVSAMPIYFESPDIDGFKAENATMRVQLDAMNQEIDQAFEKAEKEHKFVIYMANGMSASFAVGLASYLLRAGSLISSFLATVPIWKGFDPVAILVSPKKKRKKDKNTEPDNIPHPFADKVETMFTEKENQ